MRSKNVVKMLAAAVLPMSVIACADDDGTDDNGEIDLENPDLDPGEGTGLPG